MYDGQKGKCIIKDYVSIMFRKKNEIYHHKTVNKLLYYENNYINNLKSQKNWDNNNLFFTGGCDSVIKLWIDNSSLNLNLLSNFEYHSNWISNLTLCKRENYLISASNDESICIWNMDLTFKNLEKNIDKNAFLEKNISHYHTDYISCLKYDENYNILYSSGLDGKIYSANFDYLKKERSSTNEIFSNDTSIYSIDVNNKILAASLYLDNTIIIIDLQSKKEICSLRGHNDLIKSIKISPNGKNLISISSDKTIKYWDISNQKYIYNFDYHKSGVNSFFINKDFNKMISGSIDGEIYINDFELENYALFDNLNDCILDIAMNEKEDQIIASSRNGKLYIYDLFDNEKNNLNDNSEDFIGKINLNEDENKKICNITKEEIVEYKLMNNKIYSIVKYKDDDGNGAVINLLNLKSVTNSDKSTFQTLDNKLHEIDKNNLNSWCTLDIKTGFLNLTLYEDKCFENDISNINLNFIEKIIQMNFSIISDSQLFLTDKQKRNSIIKNGTESSTNSKKFTNINNSNLGKMERSSKSNSIIKNNNIRINNENKIENSFGYYIIKNIIGKIIYEKINLISKTLFENSEKKIKEEYNEFFKMLDIKDVYNDLFIITSINGNNYSFYLKNDNKMFFPPFCFKIYGKDNKKINQIFKAVNLEELGKNNLKLIISFEYIEQYLKDKKNKKIQYDTNNDDCFSKLFELIQEEFLDLIKIKKEISDEIKKNKKSRNKNPLNSQFYEYLKILFYFRTESKIIINQKACGSINIFTIIKILKPDVSDQYTLYLCCKDIKSVIKNFEIV